MVSIVSVAKAAGVSNKTVSRVINGEPYVTEETRERVEKAIRDLGYIPNMAARLIRSSRSNTFGILTDYVSTTPYSVDLVRGIQDWENHPDSQHRWFFRARGGNLENVPVPSH